MKPIAQGAEAKLYQDGNEVIKERIDKPYRIKEIDQRLRTERTRVEASLLSEARRAGVATPQIIDVSNFTIRMEFINGKRVKEVLLGNISTKIIKDIGQKIGESIAKLHNYNIIHGDLTTSNLIIKDSSDTSEQELRKQFASERVERERIIYFIDFGLGFHSSRIEDKATDLYLLYHAIESTHWKMLAKLWKIILNTYKQSFSESNKVIKTLAEIKKRGRYRER